MFDETSVRLLSVIRQLSFAKDIQSVMQTVRIAARELSGADGVTFVLREGDLCYYAEENAIAPLWKGRRFPMSQCISGWVMLNRKAAVIEDIYADPRIPADAYRPTFVKSLAMVPVRREDPLAAIGAYWATQRMPAEEEVKQLQMLADTTAVAISNVQLYESLQKSLEREQQARQAAEKANRAKDEFLAVVSHELRTPLTPIMGWLRMLRGNACNDPAHALEVIERNIEAQRRVVEDLLDFSRISTGTLKIHPVQISLSEVADTVIDSFASAAAARKIRFRKSLALQGMVYADEARLRQCVRNLISNAVRFSFPEGEIDVSISTFDGEVSLRVEDHGQGIPKEYLPHVFDGFSQQDYSNTRKHGGLGLGLSLVRHIVELHGGRVKAASAGTGLGSTFTITLPAAPGIADRGAVRSEATSGKRPVNLDGVRVLVVDDDLDTLKTIAHTLQFVGAKVVLAKSVDEALRFCRAGEIDAVVSDIVMPERDGYDLIRTLRSREGCANILAIAFTAHTNAHSREDALASGFNYFLSKPLDPEKVITTVMAGVARKA
ncbi:MAG TPA: ATP-binding protein [Planctomycetota bacterium]|nr:ATP-binding protein [Planctomycetota bacterium]